MQKEGAEESGCPGEENARGSDSGQFRGSTFGRPADVRFERTFGRRVRGGLGAQGHRERKVAGALRGDLCSPLIGAREGGGRGGAVTLRMSSCRGRYSFQDVRDQVVEGDAAEQLQDRDIEV